ncbi:MAG: glycosyltransferase family 39 protein [Ilumatobacter sp.]|uniref:glycosyltransferase family 39 protein n=1 Tax=Ilumatobacter sp. TaxID=1967498 RepID=UPI0039188C27
MMDAAQRADGERRRPGPIVAGAVAAAVMFGLGLVKIGRSFGYDEGFTYAYFINGGSVRRALTTQIVFNNHPMFAATQSVAWKLGLTGETAQRLGPLLCGAVAVGVVVWYTARRAGIIGGAAAGVVVALNPFFFDNARQLRGYALATMCVVLAAVALQRSWTDHRRRWLVAQGVCMVVAVTTHSYSAVTILMLAASSLALGHVRRAHLVTWVTSAVAALAIMSPLIDDIRANAAARGSRFDESFPTDLLRALGGWERPAVAITFAAAGIGVFEIGRRSRRHALALGAAGSVLGAVVLLLWLVIQPFDLYARFFISALPLLAVLAGVGVGRVVDGIGRLAGSGSTRLIGQAAGAGVVVALVLVLAGPVRDLLQTESPIRDAAGMVDRARAAGLEVCGRNTEPMLVYTAPMPLLSGLDGFGECEVFVSVLSMSSDVRAAVTARFDGEARLGGTVAVFADASVIDAIVAGS